MRTVIRLSLLAVLVLCASPFAGGVGPGPQELGFTASWSSMDFTGNWEPVALDEDEEPSIDEVFAALHAPQARLRRQALADAR